MKALDYQSELQKIIDAKQLVEVVIHGFPPFIAAYILNANDEYITLAEVSSSATLAGVMILRASDIDYISVETLYLSELIKQIKDDTVYRQAIVNVQNIKDFTFNGFAQCFEDSSTLVELTLYDEDIIAGRIVGHNDKILVLDEYSTHSDRRVRRTYFNFDSVSRITLDIPWIRTIARSLADKNI